MIKKLVQSLSFVLFLPTILFAAEEVIEVDRLELFITNTLEPVANLFIGRPWVQGFAIIIITFVVASFCTWVLYKVGNILTQKTQNSLDDRILSLLRLPVYYSFLVTGVITGLKIMPLSENVIMLSSRCIRTFGLIVWIIGIIRIVSIILKRTATASTDHSLLQTRTLTLFDNGAKIVILAVATYLCFVIWHIDLTAWLASAGIAGIAVGFAAKDTLANLFSGVFILADTPYKVSDYVVLDNGDRGKVLQIGLRSTRLLTRDDVEVIIPNSVMGNTIVINQSGGPNRKLRVRVKVGVSYDSDIDLVKKVLVDVASKESLVEKSPLPRVRFRNFGASSLDFELLCWAAHPELRGKLLDKLNTAVFKEFKKQQIEIPYNKQDLYIKEFPGKINV
ncbi:MAG: mechanosensitive ion channel family protein [Desulfotalea sp.]